MLKDIAATHTNDQLPLSQLTNWPLLLTKLWRPLLPENLIEHPNTLHTGLKKLGHWCIYGSAGYGKTTLASAYCENIATNYGWLTLDEDDNDSNRFALYLAAAFRVACPDPEKRNNPVQAYEGVQLHQIITSILNEAALADYPIVLALDDYHLITNENIHRNLSVLLNSASDNLSIVLCSRTRPPLSFEILETAGKIAFTGVAQLALDSDRSIAYVQTMCPDLTPESLLPLIKSIEGWPAGLRSLALFFADSHQPLTSISVSSMSASTFITNSIISDFFWEQVLNNLPHHLQEFLLQISILTIFDIGLCTAVTGNADSAALLAETLKRQLFITPLGPEQEWFRFHTLFQVFLTKHLTTTGNNLEQLHKNAAEAWFARNEIAHSLKHALVIGDQACVTRLLQHPQQALIAQGQGGLLEQALLLLTEAQLCEHNTLLILACRYWMNRNQDKVLQLIEAASKRIIVSSDNPSLSYVRALLALYRAQVAIIREDIPQAEAWAGLALNGLPDNDWLARSQTQLVLAEAAIRKGDIEKAKPKWELGEHYAALAGKHSLVTWSRHQQASMALSQGDFAKAQQLQDNAIHYCETHCFYGDKNLWFLHRARAEIAWEQFDLHVVENNCTSALQVCQHWLRNGEAPIEIIRARTQLLLGNQNKAHEHLERALELSKTSVNHGYVNSYLLLASAEFHLRFSAKSTLTNLLQRIIAPKHYRNDIDQRLGRTLAICHFGLGHIDQAVALLTQMAQDALNYRLITAAWRNNVWLAACKLAANQSQEAIALLNECLSFASERDLRGSLLICAPYLEKLFGTALGDDDTRSRHWQRIQDLFSRSRSRSRAHRDQAVPVTLSALAITPKEWRVLACIIAGASNDDIAQQLSLSLGTVKNTLTGIYRKLDVSNREQACRVAQQHL